jgi:HK97 family phage prohead protease/HK97 family phage major capsid protein
MPMTPGKDETQSEFMNRCVSDMVGPDGKKRPQDVAVAACLTMWRDEKGGEPPPEKTVKPKRKFAENVDPPDPENEDRGEFIDRCVLQCLDTNPDMDEGEARVSCEEYWDDEQRALAPKARKLRDEETREDFMQQCIEDGFSRSECRIQWEEQQRSGDKTMKTKQGEGRSDFISRCIDEKMDGNPELSAADAESQCALAWDKQGKDKPAEKSVKLKRRDADPQDGESYNDFMARCTEEEGGDEDTCQTNWESFNGPDDEERKLRKAKLKRKQEPMPGETYDDFMSRCMEDDYGNWKGDESACQLLWDEANGDDGGDEERKVPKLVVKTHAAPLTVEREFILSDETPDRLGDIIKSDGWALDNFLKNPIALFNHNPNHIVGKWANLRVDKGGLRGHLELAPEGISPRIDEIRKLVEHGILRAVSVGFRPLAHEARSKTGNPMADMMGGMIFLKSELVETSLVSIPANPNALAVVKQLDLSPETVRAVFGRARQNETRAHGRGFTPSKADALVTSRKVTTMTTPLSKRIEEMQASIVSDRDTLIDHLKKVDDTNVSDTDLEVTNTLNAQILQKEKQLAALKDAEKHLAGSSSDNTSPAVIVNKSANGHGARPFAIAPKKFDALEYVVRSGVVALFAHQNKVNPESARLQIARDYPGYGEEATKVYLDYVEKAAVNPAMTTVTGWAAELVQQVNAELMSLLQPKSVYPSLSAKGLSLSFGRNGRINIPTRSATPTIAGSFVGEGQPIPVRRGAFTAQILTPKKMAVITTWTREMNEHSIPAIEGLLREAIQEDTAVAVDSVLLDSNAATAIRPAGLRNGVSTLTPTAGGGFNALVGDIKQMTSALLTATAGNIRSMVWLMNPVQTLSISLTQAPSAIGVFPFAAEVQAGNLRGYPIIESSTVPAGTVIALDAADFVSVGGEAPRFEISDQATIHEEDTAPAPIVGGSPSATATPVRSLWQTDSLALRMIVGMNWTLRRPGMVTYITGVTW